MQLDYEKKELQYFLIHASVVVFVWRNRITTQFLFLMTYTGQKEWKTLGNIFRITLKQAQQLIYFSLELFLLNPNLLKNILQSDFNYI